MKSFKSLIAGLATVTLLPGVALAERYIVQDKDLNKIAKQVLNSGGLVHKKLQYHQALVIEFNGTQIKELKSKLPGVRIEKDASVEILGNLVSTKRGGGKTPPTPPAQSIPWGIEAIKAPSAHVLNRGAGVTVCVVDTGVQASHSDLNGQIIGGMNFTRSRGKLDLTNWNDDNGHGTHVAGTIAALDNSIGVLGVAPDAKILAAKVLDRRGSGYVSDVADGIAYCAANGAQVINLSLGSATGATVLQDAVINARNQGVTIVAAAGNESTAVSYPAAYPEVLAVTAVDSQMKLASFSNFGPEVDYAAPGVGILSTTNGDSYATYSGTSMAAPHVAGVEALKISSGSWGILTIYLNLSAEAQGNGFIRADYTVNNR